ncbi:hypothetical protein LINGRAHAP2_LOCUS17205 [Linum grandiflorum]
MGDHRAPGRRRSAASVSDKKSRISDDKYKLMIGYHELSGTKVSMLKKPLTVMKKVKPIDKDDDPEGGARRCSL